MEERVTIVFTASDHIISRLIRWATHGEVSHCYLEYSSELWGGRWSAEADAKGVHKKPAEASRHAVYAEYECSGFDVPPCTKAIRKYIGASYDYAGLGLLALIKIAWQVFKVKIRHPATSTRAQKCSELVARFLQAGPLPETKVWNPETVEPQQLLDWCRTHEACVQPVLDRGRP